MNVLWPRAVVFFEFTLPKLQVFVAVLATIYCGFFMKHPWFVLQAASHLKAFRGGWSTKFTLSAVGRSSKFGDSVTLAHESFFFVDCCVESVRIKPTSNSNKLVYSVIKLAFLNVGFIHRFVVIALYCWDTQGSYGCPGK